MRKTPRRALLVSWNARLLATAEAEDRFLTLKGVRTAAMMHLAVHDALNAIDPRFGAMPMTARPRRGSGCGRVAGGLRHRQRPVPRATRRLGGAARARHERMRDRKAREAGIALGEAAAQAVLAKRAADRWDNTATYTFHPMAPGVYAEFNEHSGTPQGFVFGAGWATVEPFALQSPTSSDRRRHRPSTAPNTRAPSTRSAVSAASTAARAPPTRRISRSGGRTSRRIRTTDSRASWSWKSSRICGPRRACSRC